MVKRSISRLSLHKPLLQATDAPVNATLGPYPIPSEAGPVVYAQKVRALASKAQYTPEGLLDHKEYEVRIAFRKPIYMSDRLLQFFGAGRFTHCEIHIPDERSAFATFLGESLAMRRDLIEFYEENRGRFETVTLKLQASEYNALLLWHANLVGKCPYNSSDIALHTLPSRLFSVVCPDLDAAQAHNPKSLFCSQAVVLALRCSLSPSGRCRMLLERLGQVNSRYVTPSMLYELMNG